MHVAPVDTERIESAKTASGSAHDIPSLDGLRALSIAIVVLSHTRTLLPDWLVRSGLFRYVIGGGLHGVQIFFTLSGYLITTLLLREYQQQGDVSFRRFYARRALRIFPAFYAYFALLASLCAAGVLVVHWPTYLASATYTFVYMPHPQGWYVEHAWSLSIEEQFYLVWPALLVFAHRRGQSMRVVLAILAAMPLVRIAFALTIASPERAIVSLGSIDMLMAGCLLALLQSAHARRAIERRIPHGGIVAALIIVGFVVVPYANAKLLTGPAPTSASALPLAQAPVLALGNTVTALAIMAMVAYVVARPRSMAGRLLNLRLMRHLGVISYSVYLWQQLFTVDPQRFGFGVYLLILSAGELSFWLIEWPVMRLRTRLGL